MKQSIILITLALSITSIAIGAEKRESPPMPPDGKWGPPPGFEPEKMMKELPKIEEKKNDAVTTDIELSPITLKEYINPLTIKLDQEVGVAEVVGRIPTECKKMLMLKTVNTPNSENYVFFQFFDKGGAIDCLKKNKEYSCEKISCISFSDLSDDKDFKEQYSASLNLNKINCKNDLKIAFLFHEKKLKDENAIFNPEKEVLTYKKNEQDCVDCHLKRQEATAPIEVASKQSPIKELVEKTEKLAHARRPPEEDFDDFKKFSKGKRKRPTRNSFFDESDGDNDENFSFNKPQRSNRMSNSRRFPPNDFQEQGQFSMPENNNNSFNMMPQFGFQMNQGPSTQQWGGNYPQAMSMGMGMQTRRTMMPQQNTNPFSQYNYYFIGNEQAWPFFMGRNNLNNFQQQSPLQQYYGNGSSPFMGY